MKEKINESARGPLQNLRFLLCDTTGIIGDLSTSDEEWAESPIQCLDKAVELKPELIVIRFGKLALKERDVLVELAAALKRNSHTKMRSVLVLLHSKHRKLLEDLNRAGVDFVKYIGQVTLDSDLMRNILAGLGPADRLERHLSLLCPFLHYSGIDAWSELTVCGAYLDRMALGGRWLHEICETEDHLRCDYYLNPRP